jgi:uncharacterized protein
VPVFALTGDRDLQVNPDDLERIRDTVTHARIETHRPVQVNHVLRPTDGIGAPSEYRKQVKAGQPLDPGVLDALTAWASARTGVHA